MNFLSQHKRLVIIISLGIVIFVVGSFILSSINQNPAPDVEKSPRPTKAPQINPENIGNPTGIEQSSEYKKSFQETEEQQKAFMEKEAAVGQLVKRLPYTGNNFSMDYSIGTNQFTATINNANREEGEAEFNQFLRQNNIASPNQIRNLTTLYR